MRGYIQGVLTGERADCRALLEWLSMQSRLRCRRTGPTRYDEQAISGWDQYTFVYEPHDWSATTRPIGGATIVGDRNITANFSEAIPNFFTPVKVNLPIKSERLRITELEFLLLSESHLTESLISSLIFIGTGVFKGWRAAATVVLGTGARRLPS